MARGNTDVNNLLRANSAARDSQLAYNDQAAAYNWDLSNKDQSALSTYSDYLKKRQAATTDPSKNLTIQSKLVAAQRGYTSAEIGRQTISVLYGDTNNTDKYAVINRLMQQAADNGDASLFQQLDETRGRLSKTIQDEAAAGAAKGAASSAAAYSKGITAQMNTWKDGEKQLDSAFRDGKPITDSKGNAVLVKYQNGKPVLDANGLPAQDPNGKPLVMGAREYAAYKGVLLRQQGELIKQQIANGDETGSHQLALDNLHNNPDYQKYATDEAAQRIGSNVNRFVTKIDENGKRSWGPADTQPVQRKDANGLPIIGEYDQAPINGRATDKNGNVTDKYVGNYVVGSDPNGPLDQFQGKTQKSDVSNEKFNIGTDAKTGKPIMVGGYGTQDVLANPKAGTVLPNGKTAQDQVYAPDAPGYHYSVQPFKKDAQGKDVLDRYGNHVTVTPSDFPQAPNQYSPGNLLSDPVNTIKNDLSGTSQALTDGAKKLGSIAAPLRGVGGLLAQPLNALGSLIDFGNNKRQVAATAAAAAKANSDKIISDQRNAIAAANAGLAAKQAQAAAANAAHPSILYSAPAQNTTVPVAQLGTKAAPIGSKAFTNTLLPVTASNGGPKAWWQI